MVCKLYYAAYVRINSPHLLATPRRAYRPKARILGLYPATEWRLAARISLTRAMMRRSYIYTPWEAGVHGQARTRRPKDAGTQANRHFQSACRGSGRPSLSRKPLFRLPGSSAGPLRDASAPPYRREVDSRNRVGLRGFTAHVLSVAGSVPSIGTGRAPAKTARPQERTQGLHRGAGLCAEPQGIGTRAHDPAVCAIHPEALRDHHPPANFGARSATGQKKTTGSKLSLFIPEGAAQSYETLRSDLLQPCATAPGLGRTLLLRRGMVAWARECGDTLLPTPPPRLPTVPSQVPFPIGREVIRIMASLILSRGKEDVYAGTESHGVASGT